MFIESYLRTLKSKLPTLFINFFPTRWNKHLKDNKRNSLQQKCARLFLLGHFLLSFALGRLFASQNRHNVRGIISTCFILCRMKTTDYSNIARITKSSLSSSVSDFSIEVYNQTHLYLSRCALKQIEEILNLNPYPYAVSAFNSNEICFDKGMRDAFKILWKLHPFTK